MWLPSSSRLLPLMRLSVVPGHPSGGPDGAEKNGAAPTQGSSAAAGPAAAAESCSFRSAAKTDDTTGRPGNPANPCVSGSRLPLPSGYCIAFSLSAISFFPSSPSRPSRFQKVHLFHTGVAPRFMKGLRCRNLLSPFEAASAGNNFHGLALYLPSRVLCALITCISVLKIRGLIKAVATRNP